MQFSIKEFNLLIKIGGWLKNVLFDCVWKGWKCYCDEGCLSTGDCCQDYKQVCVQEGNNNLSTSLMWLIFDVSSDSIQLRWVIQSLSDEYLQQNWMQFNFVDTSRAKGLFDEIPTVFLRKWAKSMKWHRLQPMRRHANRQTNMCSVLIWDSKW